MNTGYVSKRGCRCMKCETDVVAEKRIEEIIFVEARLKRRTVDVESTTHIYLDEMG